MTMAAEAAAEANDTLDGQEGNDTYVALTASNLCLASFSLLSLLANFLLLLVSINLLRRGCKTGDDSSRRPHYGLHAFVFQCLLSSVVLQLLGSLINVGYLFINGSVITAFIEDKDARYVTLKTIDIATYALFNVAHLNFVLLLNVDKLLYILRPLHYHQTMTKRRVYMVCAVTWLVAVVMALPSALYLDQQAGRRQEAIVFAMCVLCPASFDLVSAAAVGTLVYRIQARDSRAERLVLDVSQTSYKKPSRNHVVFIRTFTPIIWTCVTTMPYTVTMTYLYVVSTDDEDFMSRMQNDVTASYMTVFSCLYVLYFTGVPVIMATNLHPYRESIKSLYRAACRRFRPRLCTFTHNSAYSSVPKSDFPSTLYTSSGPAFARTTRGQSLNLPDVARHGRDGADDPADHTRPTWVDSTRPDLT